MYVVLTDPISFRACSMVISGVLPSTTVSLTPLTKAAGLSSTTCRCTMQSKNPLSAERCRFRFDAEPPKAVRYCPTLPGGMFASFSPSSSAHARNRRTAD